MNSVSLADCDIVDSHCHPWRLETVLDRDPMGFLDRITMMGMCLISSDLVDEVGEAELRRLTDSTPFARVMQRRLAAFLGCEPDRESIGDERLRRLRDDAPRYLESLWADVRLAGIVCDEGYPQPTIAMDEFAEKAALPVHRVVRIEPWIARLRESAGSFGELEDSFVAAAEQAASEQIVAFKSVIAYRTGLDVARPSRGDATAAFERWRADDFAETREHAKPVRDLLLYRTLEVARQADRPVHIHCGGGDPEIVLAHARAQDLFPLLHEHVSQPIVLIHSGQPWLDEGAYVASILPNVYLELSITMPWSSLALDTKLESLLGVAPTARVLYGSDESTEPEVLWLSAHIGRAALERVLTRGVEHDWLTAKEASTVGANVLALNTRRLHGIL